MADAITLPGTDDGQSIPAALAAPSAPKKPRAKAAKASKLARPVAPEPVAPELEAVASEPEAVAPEPLAAAEPEPIAPKPALDTAPLKVQPEPVAEAVAPEPEPVPELASEPVVASPVSTPTAAVPAEPKKESIMATTIDNVTNQTAKAQAFFTDANVRTKDAVAKSAKLFEDATAFGKGNVEALVESSKIAAKGLETIGQDVAEFGRKSFEEASTVLKTLATVKSPTEFMKLQGDFMRSQFDSMVAEASRSTETMLKLAGEVAQPISNRVAIAAEKIKVSA